MEWRKSYLDVILVPLGFLINVAYHVWLWHKTRTEPFSTTIGINAHARRLWVPTMLEDIEKKNILVVQNLRNLVMGSTLMATTSILLSTGLAVIISSTYSIKKPLDDAVYGAHSEFILALKYVTLLTIFIFSFLCHTLSIRFLNQFSILICTPHDANSLLTPQYITNMLEKGTVLNTVGNRIFYSALPMLLWISGPVLVFLCFIAMLLVFYNLDFLCRNLKPTMVPSDKKDFA
ncbi:hypothetical protein VNO77_33369 [Canavalia gladiata]|uniref:DUF599 domain-containing protein n=1 Tax=Canavalia gladiata TaxID=3824 RepID=A0AAN9PXN2_CANGL